MSLKSGVFPRMKSTQAQPSEPKPRKRVRHVSKAQSQRNNAYRSARNRFMKSTYLISALAIASLAGFSVGPKSSPRSARKCRLPGCQKDTTHPNGYCSPEHCKLDRERCCENCASWTPSATSKRTKRPMHGICALSGVRFHRAASCSAFAMMRCRECGSTDHVAANCDAEQFD